MLAKDFKLNNRKEIAGQREKDWSARQVCISLGTVPHFEDDDGIKEWIRDWNKSHKGRMSAEDAYSLMTKAVLSIVGNLEEGIRCCDKILEGEPNYSSAWTLKGTLLLESGKYDDSLACFDRSLEIDPTNPTTLNNKGVIFYRLGKYEDAINCYDKIPKKDPRNTKFFYNKSLALYKLGKVEDAMKCYNDTAILEQKDLDY